MPSECISPIQGTRARIIRNDECGVPVAGAGSGIVIDGFVQVGVSPQYEDGTEYVKTQANGVRCVNRRGNDQFQRDEVTIEFCAIDPDAVAITTGQDLVMGEDAGTGFWVREGEVTARWSLEVWQADAEAECGEEGTARYAYWVWPNLSAGRLSDFTVEDDVLEWTIVANSERASVNFALPEPTPIPLPPPANTHRGFNVTTVPPPEVTGCGAGTLTIGGGGGNGGG